MPQYLFLGAHLSLLKTEHQKSRGTLYVSGYQVQFTSRFTLYIFSLHLFKIKYPDCILTNNLVLQLDIQDWVLCQPHLF